MNKLVIVGGLIAFGMLPFISGCGGGSSNDQGISFTLLGYSDATAGECSTTPDLSGGTILIGTTAEVPGSTGQLIAGVVVQNNLVRDEATSENIPRRNFIRTQFATFEYFIPGAAVQPPRTTVPYGGVVDANGGLLCGQIPVVPAEIVSFISFNRNSMPEPPFLLAVKGTVTGITAAGDVLTTNVLDIGFTIATDLTIPPSAGDGGEGDGAGDDTGDDTGGDTGGVIVDDGDEAVDDGSGAI